MKYLTPVFCSLLLLVARPVFAGGFLIYEHGAAAVGMADARTALADDISALYYNPAAITELEGLQFQLGVTGILPYTSYQADKNAEPRFYRVYGGEMKEVDEGHDIDAKIKFFNPIHLYASYRLPTVPVTVGFALNNPFGLGTFWPGEWDGRFIATETEIHTFFSQPVVALNVAELLGMKELFKVSVAAGFNFVYGTARLAKRIDMRWAEAFYSDVGTPWGDMLMTGSATGVGWNVALYAELPGIVSVGGSLRSGVSLPFSGTANFRFTSGAQKAIEQLNLKIPEKTTGEVTVDLPMNMNFGVALLAVERLKVALDVYLALFESYKEIDIHFSCLDQEEDRCDPLEQDPIPKEWGSSWQFALGAEYMLLDQLAIRAGYGMVLSPVPDEHYDPSLPDGRRDLFCLGAGYFSDWWKLDVGYMLAMWKGEKDNHVGDADAKGNPNGMANGTYSTVAHLLAVSFSMMF